MTCRIAQSWIAAALLGAALLTGCADSRRSEAAEAVVRQPAAAPEVTRARLPAVDASFPGRDPGLAVDAAGRVHVAYVDEQSARLAYRRLDPEPGPAVPVSPPELDVSAHGEVPPVLEALADGSLVVAYPVRLPGQWKGEIRLQVSRDDGLSWSPPEVLHDDVDNHGSHSFLDGTAVGGDTVLFSWLDNRDGQQGLRVAAWSAAGIEPNRTVDAVTCQCCATALLAGPDRRLWLAYRDLAQGDVRDIVLARSDDRGASFADLGRVSADDWHIQGCPHTGARMARGSDGALWVAWFTGADPGIFVARSLDGGETFAPRRAVARPPGGSGSVAHPEIGRLEDGRLIVLYEVAGSGGRRLSARIADPAGEAWGEPFTVAEGGLYPRLAAAAGRRVLAFTRVSGDRSDVVVREVRSLPGVV